MTPELSEQLQSSLSSVLTWAESASTTANDFIVEQTPLVVQEMVVWAQVIGVGSLLLMVICYGVFGYALRKGIQSIDKTDHWDHPTPQNIVCISHCVIGGIGLFVTTVEVFNTVIPNTITAIKATFAPRLFIIDQLMYLIDQM